ncbi:hypothetical protein PHYPSEUDO_015447 [Phytophthora pseudosyringae]|uniref:Uncharacterized protein n=1 Tax=Phytophthora pseudosyringae TaxID=221518 RepID=A0A8T1W3G8_9STRA|nr:hypothetical protein PHYPSEUDO_015447 [Phytophthora pseudosyringae]
MEWLETHARLEQKREAALRRQQRELHKQKREAEAREKELQKLAARCRELEGEERLSVAMEAWHREEEARQRMALRRLEDLTLYRTISETRKKTTALGLSASTPGVSGLQRLRLLEARTIEHELSRKKANEAKNRLDALPAKRNKLTQLMHSFASCSVRQKVEHAVYHQHWDRLVPIFEPATASSGNLLNHESENGFTPVLVTIFKGKLRVLRRLLELGASPNTETRAGMTPLLAAVMTRDVVALSILLEFTVDVNYETKHQVTAVLLAADKGRGEILQALLECGANVDGVNGGGRSALIQAAISGNADLVRILFAYGADKGHRDRDGKAAVDWAIQLHDSVMVSALSSSLTSANLLAQLKAEEGEEDGEVSSSLSTNRVGRQKRTAEMDKAMREADLGRIRELLMSEGSQLSPNYEDTAGNSPLLVVCSTGTHADIVFFLENNCIPTHQNRDGINALMLACKRGDIAMILLLIKCGCNLLTRDFCGRDAFHYLNSHDHPDLAIEFTNNYHKQHRDRNPGLLLGSLVSSMILVMSGYTISLGQADISFALESESDQRSRTADEAGSVEPVYEEEEDGGEESATDPAIRKWSFQQKTLKRDRQRRQLFDKERERILAARTRGRRNGLIAPLPSDQTGRLKFPTCDNCHQSRARKRCPSCDQVLCDKCHARLHELAYRRHHQYEELKPELHVGHELKEVAPTNQENSLQHTVLKSSHCVAEMRTLLLGDDFVPALSVSPRSIDPEVENYQRKKRIGKEKAISQMQINVPVVAAKHAAQAGEETIFTQPAELELAALYTTQKKYEKARDLLGQVEKMITDSLGILHPIMLKVAIGKARISQENGHFGQCIGTMEDALSLFEGVLPLDHKDILTATSMLLQSLEALEHYHKAVLTCRHMHSIRVRVLPPTHKCLKEICEQLDEFISKRETVEMGTEDLITLAKIEDERKRMEELANESEKRLMIEDPGGLAVFLTFARQEFAEDLVKLWLSIEEFKEEGIDSKTLRTRAVNTYLTYIKSPRIKVITAVQRKKLKKAITTPKKKLSRTIYDDVQAQIFELVYKGPTSDDEDVEYVRGGATRSRPGYRQKALDKPFSRKIDRARNPVRSDAYGDDSTSQYSSTTGLSRFERHPEGRNASLSPSRLEDSGGVCVTTMDEDDQQMFIALFYWRRKVIEAHFSAWKWVVFSLPQSAKQIHRHGMSIRRSKPIAAGYGSMGLRPPRRNLILKRHTGLSSAEESEKNDSGAEFEEPVVPTKPSLHGIGSKGFKRNSSLLVNKASENAQSTGKRRQFRAELCLVFSCFRQWKSNADASRRRRVHQLVQAAHFQRAQELKNALRAWKAGSKLLELKRKRLENADQFHWNCAKRNVFREWKRYCRVEREIARRQTLHAVRQKRLAFQRWCQCILQTRLCRKLAEKRCYNHLRIVFRSLREGLLEVKRERLKYALAISHYQKQLQVSMLHLWREAIFQDPFYLLLVKLFRKKRSRNRVKAIFRLWRVHAYVCIATRKRDLDRAQLSLVEWKRVCRGCKENRIMTAVAAQYYSERRYAIAIKLWSSFVKRSSRSRRAEGKALSIYFRRIMIRSLQHWYIAARRLRRQAEFLAYRQQVRDDKAMTRCLQAWLTLVRQQIQRRTQEWTALQFQMESLQQRSFYAWVQLPNARRASSKKLSFAVVTHKNNLLGKVLRAWRLSTRRSTELKGTCAFIQKEVKQRRLQSSVAQWSNFCLERQRCRKQTAMADKFYRGYLMCLAMYHWQEKWSQASTLRHKEIMVSRLNNARRLAKAVFRWHENYQHSSRARAKTTKASQFYTKKVLATRFELWKRHQDAVRRKVSKRRHLTATEYRRLDNLQTTLLRTWRARVQHRLNQRAKAAKAVAFQKAKLREKAWKSWLRYITYCHEKQKQMVWVLSYYSVEVLLRRSLAAWKEMVGMKQMQREHDALAASYSSHRLIREGYREWREYVSRRRLKVERLEGILHTSELLALSRSIRKWRSRAVVLRRQHLNPVLAAQFYSRRRLTCGLNKLVKWKTSQKSTRELTLQAKRFGDEKAVAACFRCWQRYHQWRVRYAHLTQVFQRNQKGDVLARWKRYWWKRQSINEKLLQARVFHCIRVEQKMLTAWRNFVHTRKHKKVAIAFNRATVLQETFTIWKRRVHVLRQMRKMFICQASFRAQTHFGAWKRFVVARKQMNERLRGAMKFNDKLRRLDVWQKWRAWVSMQGQERATIELAVEFRQRFFTRKTFSVWKRRAANWNFQRALTDQALLQWRISLLRRGFQLFAGWRQSKAKLARLQRELATQLVKKRKRHAVATLRALCVESDRKRGLMKQSCHHWQLCHQQKYWGRIMQWFGVAKWHKLQRAQADAFARTHLLRRCVVALEAHICRTKQLKTTVDAFRCRYFRSVADNCFYQWKSFTAFKLKLRVFRRKTQQMQRRQRLLHWRHIAVEQERRHSGMLQIAVRRRHRQLVAWFNHWESVCTDQWVEKELVAHHQRHAQKQRRLRGAVQALKAQLPARRERHKCKSFFLQRHKSFLLQVFQHWRHAAEITRPLQHVTCEQNV